MIYGRSDRHSDFFVGERGASDGAQSLVSNQEFVPDVQAIADGQEGLPLALFGALSVTHMQGSGVVIAGRERGTDAGVHASA
jgi:hypothetical protein